VSKLRYLSVCSGIEAATVAWHPFGWEAAAFSEIEAFPRAVLSHHYPAVPCHGDFTTIKGDEYGSIDLLVGGTPCQSFSVAGLRGGLADDRGNLALEYLRLADRARPRWLVWENVPGVLSSNEGRDFGSILGGMAELGYGFAYRILDAQFCGVPQRRRRVFVIGYIGDWRRAAAVLFERHSLQGDFAPRRETGKRIAGCLSPGAHPGGFNGQDAYNGQLIGGIDYENNAHGPDDVTGPLLKGSPTGGGRRLPAIAYQVSDNCGAWETGDITGALDTGTDPSSNVICFGAKDHGADAGDISPTLRSGSHSGSHANGGVMPAVAFDLAQTTSKTNRSRAEGGLPAPTMSKASSMHVATSAVRRLTPLECEHLQGFPDGYTDVPYRGKRAADGPRYKALGNSMAVPCMSWIGQRIALVDAIPFALREAA
jgi:DNA (cytosine-5)-methyltransferase 1